MSTKNINDVRVHLFRMLDELSNTDTQPDYERIRTSCDVVQVLVNIQKVQVDYLKVIQGDGEVPFLDEVDAIELGGATPPAPFVGPPQAGPAADHPWRSSRVHRLQR